MRDQPTAEEIEDETAVENLKQELRKDATTQKTLQPTAAPEMLPAAGTMGASESVVVDTPVITQRPLQPFPLFNFVIGWGVFLIPGGECR